MIKFDEENYLDINDPRIVDVLRDEAIKNEDSNINKALVLMSAAGVLRPDGPVIISKIAEYKKKLLKKKNLCIVHIGMHKTGTSSIQYNLSKTVNKNFSYFSLGTPNHSIPIYSLFTEYPVNYHIHRRCGRTQKQVDEYNLDVDEMFRKHLLNNSQNDTFVISGEDINGLSEQSLINFKNYLSKFFESIKIVAYVRSPISYMSSAFQENIKAGSSLFDINKSYPHYRHRLEKFDLLFGKKNVFFNFFDKKSLIGEDVSIDFIKKNNLIVEDEKAFSNTNESLSLEAVSLLYVYNKFYTHIVENQETAGSFYRLIASLSNFGSTKFQLSRKLVEPIVDQNKKDIDWIEDRLGMKLLDNENYSVDNGSIGCEEDLFEVAVKNFDNLIEMIIDKELVKDFKTNSLNNIASLMGILRIQLSKIEEIMV